MDFCNHIPEIKCENCFPITGRWDTYDFNIAIPQTGSINWQLLYDTLKHGEDDHRAWLRGLIAGFASKHEGRRIELKE